MSDPFHDVRAPGLEARTCGGTHDACVEMDRLSQLLCACDDGVLTEEGLHEAAVLAERLGRTDELFDALMK